MKKIKLPVESTALWRNALAVGVLFGVASLWWDGWWHAEIGRDSFSIPPHMLEYFAISVVSLASVFLYLITRQKTYMWVVLCQIAVALMGAGDAQWHILFGYEDLTSPLAIWSPPHLGAATASLAGTLVLLTAWISDWQPKDNLAFFRISLLAAAALSFLNFLLVPLQPFGWHNLIGLAGPVVTIFVSVLFGLLLVHALPQTGIATYSTLTLLVFIGFRSTSTAPNILLPPHADPPLWLNFMASLPAAILLDMAVARRRGYVAIGALAGFLVYAIYWLNWDFIDRPEFFYSKIEALFLVLSSTVGGLLAGVTISIIQRITILQRLIPTLPCTK